MAKEIPFRAQSVTLTLKKPRTCVLTVSEICHLMYFCHNRKHGHVYLMTRIIYLTKSGWGVGIWPFTKKYSVINLEK